MEIDGICEVFEVVINSDSTEGRGRDYVCARFFTLDAAKNFAKGRDVMGSDGRVQNGWVVCVPTNSKTKCYPIEMKYYPIGSEVPVFESIEHKARTEALNKLTLAERKLLGLA